MLKLLRSLKRRLPPSIGKKYADMERERLLRLKRDVLPKMCVTIILFGTMDVLSNTEGKRELQIEGPIVYGFMLAIQIISNIIVHVRPLWYDWVQVVQVVILHICVTNHLFFVLRAGVAFDSENVFILGFLLGVVGPSFVNGTCERKKVLMMFVIFVWLTANIYLVRNGRGLFFGLLILVIWLVNSMRILSEDRVKQKFFLTSQTNEIWKEVMNNFLPINMILLSLEHEAGRVLLHRSNMFARKDLGVVNDDDLQLFLEIAQVVGIARTSNTTSECSGVQMIKKKRKSLKQHLKEFMVSQLENRQVKQVTCEGEDEKLEVRELRVEQEVQSQVRQFRVKITGFFGESHFAVMTVDNISNEEKLNKALETCEATEEQNTLCSERIVASTRKMVRSLLSLQANARECFAKDDIQRAAVVSETIQSLVILYAQRSTNLLANNRVLSVTRKGKEVIHAQKFSLLRQVKTILKCYEPVLAEKDIAVKVVHERTTCDGALERRSTLFDSGQESPIITNTPPRRIDESFSMFGTRFYSDSLNVCKTSQINSTIHEEQREGKEKDQGDRKATAIFSSEPILKKSKSESSFEKVRLPRIPVEIGSGIITQKLLPYVTCQNNFKSMQRAGSLQSQTAIDNSKNLQAAPVVVTSAITDTTTQNISSNSSIVVSPVAIIHKTKYDSSDKSKRMKERQQLPGIDTSSLKISSLESPSPQPSSSGVITQSLDKRQILNRQPQHPLEFHCKSLFRVPSQGGSCQTAKKYINNYTRSHSSQSRNSTRNQQKERTSTETYEVVDTINSKAHSSDIRIVIEEESDQGLPCETEFACPNTRLSSLQLLNKSRLSAQVRVNAEVEQPLSLKMEEEEEEKAKTVDKGISGIGSFADAANDGLQGANSAAPCDFWEIPTAWMIQDMSRVNIILTNLIENAIFAGRNSSQIQINITENPPVKRVLKVKTNANAMADARVVDIAITNELPITCESPSNKMMAELERKIASCENQTFERSGKLQMGIRSARKNLQLLGPFDRIKYMFTPVLPLIETFSTAATVQCVFSLFRDIQVISQPQKCIRKSYCENSNTNCKLPIQTPIIQPALNHSINLQTMTNVRKSSLNVRQSSIYRKDSSLAVLYSDSPQQETCLPISEEKLLFQYNPPNQGLSAIGSTPEQIRRLRSIVMLREDDSSRKSIRSVLVSEQKQSRESEKLLSMSKQKAEVWQMLRQNSLESVSIQTLPPQEEVKRNSSQLTAIDKHSSYRKLTSHFMPVSEIYAQR